LTAHPVAAALGPDFKRERKNQRLSASPQAESEISTRVSDSPVAERPKS